MKKYTYTLLFLLLFVETHSQTFEILDGDTINRIDRKLEKQGRWLIYNNLKTVIAEGNFKDNRKDGLWKFYYETGSIMSEYIFVNGVADGKAREYHKNGNVAVEGIWHNSKWRGTYKRYHENGLPACVWQYNKSGKREGKQMYYYENGQVQIEGNWEAGKKNGKITSYYENGSLKSEKTFLGNVLDKKSVKKYKKKNTTVADNNQNSNQNNNKNTSSDSTKTDENRKITYFDGNGKHTLYNKDRKVEREGVFEDGKLMDGIRYIYEKETGKLIKKAIYKNGRLKKVITVQDSL